MPSVPGWNVDNTCLKHFGCHWVIFEVAWRECVKCGEEKDSKEVVTILKVTFLAAEKKLPMGL